MTETKGGKPVTYTVIPYLLGEKCITFTDLGEAIEYAEENYFDPGYDICEDGEDE